MSAVGGTVNACFEFVLFTHIVSTDRAHTAVLLTARAVLAIVANAVPTAFTRATVLGAGKAGFIALSTLAIATGWTGIAVRCAREAVLTICGSAESVATGVAHATIAGAINAGFAVLTFIVATAFAEPAVHWAVRTAFIGIADIVSAGIA